MIHPTAIISPGVDLEEEVKVGPYSVIEGNVRIGSGTVISSGVRIEGDIEIGRNNHIFAGAVLGTAPQHVSYQGEQTFLKVGDGNIIREYVTIHRGTVIGGGTTRVGNENYIMAYCHLGHDCQVGDRVTISNGTQVSGHVLIEDDAVLSGLVGVHQFVRIGKLVMVGGGSMIAQDVPPFGLVSGDRARLYGINRVGLRRKGLSREAIRNIQEAYQVLFRFGLSRQEAIQKVRESADPSQPGGAEIMHLVNFVQDSQRGLVRCLVSQETRPADFPREEGNSP